MEYKPWRRNYWEKSYRTNHEKVIRQRDYGKLWRGGYAGGITERNHEGEIMKEKSLRSNRMKAYTWTHRPNQPANKNA